ncbi:C-type lectin receptor-like tyrosine-protein kinase At1g52310 isoform X1 [Nicotiana tabacum]|uniref:C-type lectin receptor-like tyrosine-protein kinase At1g52310 isoform X1 n=1 Tax=Nicotiana tabacum TaxID=4097 RepID=A0A1S4AGT2_TOBAC|nr:C-type lectin receptor-like tyrosine-protein kinase At1g52310 isoform X1 [Nicotiana tomentosiformis]XP_016475824.1 PREDICTED: C-type lectin receptor-like tyrosine-protein kinase At1g52310 isoform X1 [Nicotiana tabacum]
MGVKLLMHLQFPLLLFSCFLLQLSASTSVSNKTVDAQVAPSSENQSHDDAGRCDPGWFSSPNGKKCFKYNATSLQWDESEIYCNSFGGNLAAITSSEELNFVQKLCGNDSNRCWVGGKSINTTAGLGWKWSDNEASWNESLDLKSTFNSSCKNFSCYGFKSADLCTSITNGTTPLIAERCNTTHASICMLDAGSKCRHMRCHREYLIILAVVSGLILCTTLAVVIWLLVYRRSKRRRRSRASLALVPPSWKIFNRDEVKSMTKNFSEVNRLLGDAKTGGTYSGLLPDGSRVAVKRLKRSGFQRKKEFYSEIGRVARLHHPNLVSIKGCCYHHGDRYILYEFIINGPLDRWLHHIPRGGRSLDWSMRMKVATTLAQGIAFLHDKVKPQVVHRDIRASNVLLDEDFGAHLMGVGLSKFVPWEVMHERRVMAGGTHGYLAPEFVYRNELTTKSDVYSFGVLLLEIMSGRRPAQAVDSVGWQSIFEWATPLVQAHRYVELLDPLISSSSSSRIPEVGVIQKVVDLVYSCTQHVPSMRPRMSHVVHQLQQLAQPPSVK